MLNKNPYSDEMKQVPDTYWLTQLMFLQGREQLRWNQTMVPHAELIGNIANPEVYQQYVKMKKEMEKSKSRQLNQEKEELIQRSTASGLYSSEATTYYDPIRGLVDEKGNVLIPKETFEKSHDLGGVAISY